MRHLRCEVGIAPLPAEPIARLTGIGNKIRRIAGSAWADLHGNIAVADSASDVDEFTHRPTAAGADIECRVVGATDECAQCCDMRVGKIADMDIIARAGAICGRIVITEDRETLAVSSRRIK